MFASLKGVLEEKTLQRIVVDVGGVGYLVHVSGRTLAELPTEGEMVRLLCHTHVREDAIQIFGFLEPNEKLAFELLISVSGIGPKLALTVLSGVAVRDLFEAIAKGDYATLQRVPGVGKKTAERVVVELKDKCAKLNLLPEGGEASGQAPGPETSEVIDALTNLGYKRNVAEKAVKRVLDSTGGKTSPEVLLRSALVAIAEK